MPVYATVMITVLNKEPVISKSLLEFTSRVNNEPLLSMFLAKPNPEIIAHNRGINRPDAAMHVIVISDENDQSDAELSRSEFVNFLRTLKNDPEIPVTFSSIVGPPPAGCSSAGGGRLSSISPGTTTVFRFSELSALLLTFGAQDGGERARARVQRLARLVGRVLGAVGERGPHRPARRVLRERGLRPRPPVRARHPSELGNRVLEHPLLEEVVHLPTVLPQRSLPLPIFLEHI